VDLGSSIPTQELVVSKFRIKLKMQALELEIEGVREDASLISRNIGQQMAGLLHPIAGIIDGESIQQSPALEKVTVFENPAVKKSRRRRNLGPSSNGIEGSAAIDFKHAPEKYGNPKQEWKTAQKALWLLYVVKEVGGVGELSTRNLVETFNKHFRQSGQITTSNVTRDLGRLKAKGTPAPVGEDATKTPPTWYLTEEGRKRAQALVAEALGQPG
jgi:hypothetical protein